VDFGELNDKAIKVLMILSKIVSRFSLYIHEQPLKHFNYGCILRLTFTKDKYMVQDFMSLLKKNKMMSIHTMVLKSGSLHIRCQSRSNI
jgi:diphthamide biosynthesis methyltransferase